MDTKENHGRRGRRPNYIRVILCPLVVQNAPVTLRAFRDLLFEKIRMPELA